MDCNSPWVGRFSARHPFDAMNCHLAKTSQTAPFLAAHFFFLSPRRGSGARTEERGNLAERPSSPRPLLHPMEEREFLAFRLCQDEDIAQFRFLITLQCRKN